MNALSSLRLGALALAIGVAGCSSSGGGDDALNDELHRRKLDAGQPQGQQGGGASTMPGIKTVFIIVMENHAWSLIKGNPSAPYINGTLLAQGAHAENYYNPPGNHPSEPNYIWLEAGDKMGITTDADPSPSHSLTGDHFVAQLEKAGKSWHAYEEDMPNGVCPIQSSNLYAAKHNPMVFFQDVSGAPPSSSDAFCMQHEFPLTQLAGDLAADSDGDYNFITPNLCHDMHGATGCPSDLVKAGDDFLAQTVPMILASESYQDAGALFIVWDESEKGDFPIGMIVMSEFARPGHASSAPYTHSSTLRSFEDAFALPALRNAATATPLLDLFLANGGNNLGDGGLEAGPAVDSGLIASPTYYKSPLGYMMPNPNFTPGTVMTSDLGKICKSGYTSTVRSVSSQEKAQVATQYAYSGPSSGVEYDHLISLELGGGNDPTNLWPEPIAEAHIKDGLENYLHAAVCANKMNLADVQKRIATDWVQLWIDVGKP